MGSGREDLTRAIRSVRKDLRCLSKQIARSAVRQCVSVIFVRSCSATLILMGCRCIRRTLENERRPRSFSLPLSFSVSLTLLYVSVCRIPDRDNPPKVTRHIFLSPRLNIFGTIRRMAVRFSQRRNLTILKIIYDRTCVLSLRLPEIVEKDRTNLRNIHYSTAFSFEIFLRSRRISFRKCLTLLLCCIRNSARGRYMEYSLRALLPDPRIRDTCVRKYVARARVRLEY